jgi:hypothetical protein
MAEDPPFEDDGRPESLLPYDRWMENALREVVVAALEHAARYGLPGAHHFYITFRTDWPGVSLPAPVKAKYPREITIVLQHQFWDLEVDRARGEVRVGLSFGGVPSRVVFPLAAITGFVDPSVNFGLQFSPPPLGEPETSPLFPAREESLDASSPPGEGEAEATRSARPAGTGEEEAGQVVRLDAFRRRPSGPASSS